VHDDLDSNLAARTVQTIGDVEPGFRAADLVVRERLAISRGGGGMMETRGVLAAWDTLARKLQVWSSTQAPHLIRRVLSPQTARMSAEILTAVTEPGGTGTQAVVAGSPAHKAGIKENDIVLEINGDKLTEKHELADVIQTLNVGDELEMTVMRGKDTMKVKTVLEERK